jgi:hypothetical protein
MSSSRTPWFAALFTLLVATVGPAPAGAAETESAMARGARLYDKWFEENKAAKPTTDHPSYTVKDGKYGKDTSWRCKECHGWDYRGKDGAYAKGGHATGIVGVSGAKGKDPAAIAAMLRDKTHGYTAAQLSDKDAADLALFISKGQLDVAKYVEGVQQGQGQCRQGRGLLQHRVRRMPRHRRQEAEGRAAPGLGGRQRRRDDAQDPQRAAG